MHKVTTTKTSGLTISDSRWVTEAQLWDFRNAVLEEAAKACRVRAERCWAVYKGMAKDTELQQGDSYVRGLADGADNCAELLLYMRGTT